MFENHQNILTKLISDNNILINQRMDLFAKEIEEVKSSIEMTDSILTKQAGEIKQLQEKSKIIKTNEVAVLSVKTLTTNLQEKIVDLENRSRRNNLRVDGITEHANETWQVCEEKIKELLKNKLKLKEDIKIERAHRTGKGIEGKPRTIVFKLLSYKDKSLILGCAKRLSGTGIYINEDYAKETVEKRKKLWEEVKRHRREGKYAIIQYDKIIVRNHRPKP